MDLSRLLTKRSDLGWPGPARRLSVVGLAALVLGAGAAPAAADPISESQGFRKQVTVAGIREHQSALQQIANANGGNRAAGTAGYDASVDYIFDRAEAAGLDVSLDEFTYVESFSEGSTPVLRRSLPSLRPSWRDRARRSTATSCRSPERAT